MRSNMRELLLRSRLKQDLKRIVKRGKNKDVLLAIAWLLVKGTSLPEHCRPHKLSGIYAGLWECHVENDWLLIYNSTEHDVILYRTGTHADLFE